MVARMLRAALIALALCGLCAPLAAAEIRVLDATGATVAVPVPQGRAELAR